MGAPYSTLIYAQQGLGSITFLDAGEELSGTVLVQDVSLYCNSADVLLSIAQFRITYNPGTAWFVLNPLYGLWDVYVAGVILSGTPLAFYVGETGEVSVFESGVIIAPELPYTKNLSVKWPMIYIPD